MKKLISLVLVLAMVFALGITASASSESMQKELTYRGISIVVDGEKINPLGAGGASVEPFIMDDYTYLPLRAIGYAFGFEVGWDEATSTVTLTRGGEQKQAAGEPTATNSVVNGTITYRDIKIILDGQEISIAVEPFVYNGSTYLPVRALSDVLGVEVDWDDATSTVFLNGEWAYLCTKMVSDLGEKYEYTYGAYGNVIKEKATFVDGSGYTALYTYDEYGNMLSYENGGEKYVWTYDERGNQLTEVIYIEGVEAYRNVYTYDANGNQTAWYEAYDGVALELRELYTYNEDGLPLTYKYYYGENSYYLYTNTYDENGNCTSTVDEDYYEGELFSTSYYSSTYDEYGNETSYRYSSGSFSCESLYEYDSNGNCVMTNYHDSEGYSYTEETYFDEDGVYWGYARNNSDGSRESENYEYDENGDMVYSYYYYEYADGTVEWSETNYGYSEEHYEEHTDYSDGSYSTYVIAFNEYGDLIYDYWDNNGDVYEESIEYTYAWVLI